MLDTEDLDDELFDDAETSDEDEDDGETKLCKTCGGSGFVAVMGQVWPNEPHQALVDESPCPDCNGVKDNEDSDET